MANTVIGYNVSDIRKLFRDYVLSFGSSPRHPQAAVRETELFNEFLNGAFPLNGTIRSELYQRMMNCAVEFEESGFIAGFQVGFQCAANPDADHVNLVCANGDPSMDAISSQTANPSASEREKPGDVPAEPKNVKSGTSASISSREIADMFGTTNAKVVYRIEDVILPALDKKRKRFFRLTIGTTRQHRRCKMYYLNKAACELYLAEMDPSKKFVNVANGIVELTERMKAVFGDDADDESTTA